MVTLILAELVLGNAVGSGSTGIPAGTGIKGGQEPVDPRFGLKGGDVHFRLALLATVVGKGSREIPDRCLSASKGKTRERPEQAGKQFLSINVVVYSWFGGSKRETFVGISHRFRTACPELVEGPTDYPVLAGVLRVGPRTPSGAEQLLTWE